MKNKVLNRTKYLRHALLMSILFFGSIHVNAQTQIASWAYTNSSTTTYPKAAYDVLAGSGLTATENNVGIERVNDARNMFRHPNTATTLNINTAPYFEYSLNFGVAKRIDFNSIIFGGLTNAYSKMQVRWSVDNYATSLGELPQSGNYNLCSSYLSSLNEFVGTSVTFRIYCYAHTFPNGSAYIAMVAGNYTSNDGTWINPSGRNVAIYVNSIQNAVPNVNIVSSGGTSEGSTWSYSNGTISPNSVFDVNINASDIVSKLNTENVSIQTIGSITISSSITSTSNKSLTLKSNKNIYQAASVNVSTNGGNVTYWSDSDNDGQGAVCVAINSTITTNGGNITLGGGTDITTGYASAASGFVYSTKPYGGVAVFGSTLNAQGGNIVIRGAINSQMGSVNGRAVILDTSTVKTSGSGSITIDGTAGSFAATNPWGSLVDTGCTLETEYGDINITGKGGTGSNSRGVIINGSNTYVQTVSGNINVTDKTDSTSANFYGTYINMPKIGTGSLPNVSSGNITFKSDGIGFDGGISYSAYTQFNTSSNIKFEPYTNSFTTNPQLFDKIDIAYPTSITLGKPGNTSNITLGSPYTYNTLELNYYGDLNIYANNIIFRRQVTYVYNMNLYNTGSISQAYNTSDRAITADNLNLYGTGNKSFNNPYNNFYYLSAGTDAAPTGNISVYNGKDLTVWSDRTNAINSTGTINIRTYNDGDLYIEKKIKTTYNFSTAVNLYADYLRTRNAACDASSSGGNIKFSSSATIELGANGRARLYSGSPSLSTRVSGRSSNVYYRSDVSNVPTTANTGIQALYRSDSTNLIGAFGPISGPTSLASDVTTATYSVAPVTGATSYVWGLPAGMTLTSQTGATITVNLNSNYSVGTITAKAVNQCRETAIHLLKVSRSSAISMTITGAIELCASTIEIYTATTVAGGNYLWTVPTNVVIVSGQGTSSITVSASQGFSSGQIGVTCTTSDASLNATMIISGAPVPTAISGPNTVCSLSQAVYSVATVVGLSYDWSVPSGMTITSGQGTSSIVVSIGGSSISGTITVRSVSSCGMSAPIKHGVGSTPALGGINGVSTICGALEATIGSDGQILNNNPLNQYTYSVASVSGVSNYTWTVPTGATIVSGQGTNTVVVSYNMTTFESGVIGVQATNTCGTGALRTFPVSSIRGNVSGPASLNSLTTATYSVPSDLGTNFVWTLPQGMSITNGSGTSVITVSINHPINFASSNRVSVQFTTPCGGVRTLALTVNCTEYTSIINSQCGAVIDFGAKIYANVLNGATGYAFDISDVNGTPITTLETPSNFFRFTQFNFTYGATYNVKIRAKQGTFYGASGPTCNITVSNIPTTTLVASQCNTNIDFNVKVYPVGVTGATGYAFDIYDASGLGSPIATIENLYNYFRLNQFNYTIGATYQIKVRVKQGNSYGIAGSACSLLLASGPLRLKVKSFEVSAYPNPFDTAFNLNLETPNKEEVTIAVYDMMGKLVETHQVNPTDVANLQIGNNFAAGIYNVIVSQANEMQAIRLIRK